MITAFTTIMSVLYASEIEIFFPVRTLFLQRSGAVADFYPASGVIFAEAGLLHVAQIFALGHRSLAEGLRVDCFEQICFTAGFYTGSD